MLLPSSCGTVFEPSGVTSSLATGAWFTTVYADSPPIYPTDPINAGDGSIYRISNAGYMNGATQFFGPFVSSPNTDVAGINPFELGSYRDPIELYENGVAATPLGFLYDPIVNAPDLEIFGERRWVIAPTCSDGAPAYLPSSSDPSTGSPVPDDIKQEICDLVATGFSRSRTQNARGQLIVNVGDRAFLYTPVPEPSALALLGIAFAGLGFARRRKLH
jgi:hypothetical protein